MPTTADRDKEAEVEVDEAMAKDMSPDPKPAIIVERGDTLCTIALAKPIQYRSPK